MKKSILKSVLVAFLVSSSVISCTTNEQEITNKNDALAKPPPPALAEFYYKEGGALTFSSVSNPYAKLITKKIFAQNGSTSVIEIQLSSFAVGTYYINSLNKYVYKKPFTTQTWQATKGKIVISFNASGLLSGTYSMYSGTGISSVNSMNGYFEVIPIAP